MLCPVDVLTRSIRTLCWPGFSAAGSKGRGTNFGERGEFDSAFPNASCTDLGYEMTGDSDSPGGVVRQRVLSGVRKEVHMRLLAVVTPVF